MPTVIDRNGMPLAVLSGPINDVISNVPIGSELVEDFPVGMVTPIFTGGSWYDMSVIKPKGDVRFDYESKQWIQVNTLDTIKDSHWQLLKIQRDNLEFGGFMYKGAIYDSDTVSQARILAASLSGLDQVWTTKMNVQVSLSAAEMKELYTELQLHVMNVHDRGRKARDSLYKATTQEEIEKVQL